MGGLAGLGFRAKAIWTKGFSQKLLQILVERYCLVPVMTSGIQKENQMRLATYKPGEKGKKKTE